MATTAQITANQANSQHSTGPVTDAGKAKSSLNAVKSGLTGRTVLLPTDDAAEYHALIYQLTGFYAPVGPQEQALVQSIVDGEWRLDRIPSLEYGIYAMGQLEFAPLYADQPEALRATLIQTKTYLVYQRQLNNLAIQTQRLRRNIEKDIAALKALQADRTERCQVRLDQAVHSLMSAIKAGAQKDWTPQKFGFEFSIQEVIARADKLSGIKPVADTDPAAQKAA